MTEKDEAYWRAKCPSYTQRFEDSKPVASDKPRITNLHFKTDRKDKARRKASLANALMSNEGDMKKALADVDLSPDTLKRYLQEDNFQNVLDKIAPHISGKVLVNILRIADGGEGKDVHLKANLEILKEFAGRATNGNYTFDAGVRKARAEGEEDRTNMTFKDMVGALARDKFVDYSEEIRKVRDTPTKEASPLADTGKVAEAIGVVEEYEEWSDES